MAFSRTVTIKDSSNIHMLTYDPIEESLIVVFKDSSQSKYRYEGVPGDLVGQVAFSKSVGSALRSLITPKYEGKRL